jgi:hypothetical protein
MQGAGYPVAEVARLALGIVRLIITDVAYPGRSFHVVAAAHFFTLPNSSLKLKLFNIMHLLADKGKRREIKKGPVVDD